MFSIYIFILGLFIGSFLNVVIYRLPRRESIVFPPSHCPHCRHRLAWYDLLPVFSYLLLLGKCRYCRVPISLYYPIVELLTGLLFFVLYVSILQFNFIYFIYLLVMGCIFIVIFFTDLKYGIIPFQVILLGIITVLTYLLYTFSLSLFLSHILSSVGAFLAFFFLFYITKGRGMGFGDVTLALLMGLFLSFPDIAFALYIAFLTGAVVSLILILIGNKHLRHDTIPFGPFLVIGTFTSLFFGSNILQIVHTFFPM